MPPPKTVVYQCTGLKNERVQSLLGVGSKLWGSISTEYLFRVVLIESHSPITVAQLKYQFQLHHPKEVEALQSVIQGIPLYSSSADCLKSTVCTSVSNKQTCSFCDALAHDKEVLKRSARAEGHDSTYVGSKFTNHDLVRVHTLL